MKGFRVFLDKPELKLHAAMGDVLLPIALKWTEEQALRLMECAQLLLCKEWLRVEKYDYEGGEEEVACYHLPPVMPQNQYHLEKVSSECSDGGADPRAPA